MAAQPGTIQFHDDQETLRFQIEGWATMNQSLAFRRFVEQRLADRTRRVWVDLDKCTYIDSTFLGTLLFIQRAIRRLGCGELRLLAPSTQCATLLRQMGVLDVFHVASAAETAPPSWTLLTREQEDKQCFQRNVIQAHEELAALPGAAGEPFRAVVRCLAKDAESQK
jgi:anti-anti-sigma factor